MHLRAKPKIQASGMKRGSPFKDLEGRLPGKVSSWHDRGDRRSL